MWWSLAATASTLVLGDPTFRAPDGIGAAVVADDGSVWTMSTQGEVTGFDPSGRIRKTFQACDDRSVHLELIVDPSGSRAGVDCGPVFRLFSLPGGEPLFEVDVFTADSAFSPDGRWVALLGERIVDGVSEEASYLLRYNATTGEPAEPKRSDWDAIWGVQGGWVGATTRHREGGPLHLEARIRLGPTALNWHWVAPEALRSADWGPHDAVGVVDEGTQVCVLYDFGGACLDGRTGGPRKFWSVPASEQGPTTRAMPHPDGLVVGEELWFKRADGVWRWPIEGEISRLEDAVDVPISNRAGTVRYRMESTQLVPIGPTGKDLSDSEWGLPSSVARSADGLLLLADDRGRVFSREPSGEVQRLAPPADRVALSADGSEAWLFSESAPTRVISLATGSSRTDPALAVAFDGAQVWTVAPRDRVPWLHHNGEPVVAVAEALEITGLQVVGKRVLVEYGQDDAYQVYDGTQLEPMTHLAYSNQTDIRLTPEGVLGFSETETGWQIANTVLPWSSTLRFLPDGSGFLRLTEDGNTVALHDLPSGTVRESYPLPGRWRGIWADDGVVAIALRDGRLVLIDL